MTTTAMTETPHGYRINQSRTARGQRYRILSIRGENDVVLIQDCPTEVWPMPGLPSIWYCTTCDDNACRHTRISDTLR